MHGVTSEHMANLFSKMLETPFGPKVQQLKV